MGLSPWSCSWSGALLLPGETEGAARIPHPAPWQSQAPTAARTPAWGGSLECQVRGGFTHSIKEAWSRPRRNVASFQRQLRAFGSGAQPGFLAAKAKWVGLPPPPPGFTSADTAFPGGPVTGSRVCPCPLCTAGQRGKRPGLHRVPVPPPSTPAPGSPFLQDCPPHGSDTRLPAGRLGTVASETPCDLQEGGGCRATCDPITYLSAPLLGAWTPGPLPEAPPTGFSAGTLRSWRPPPGFRHQHRNPAKLVAAARVEHLQQHPGLFPTALHDSGLNPTSADLR